jgi:diguanylate cyclase (GGDEF)-like protein/PAS domain S-box-containing protein
MNAVIARLASTDVDDFDDVLLDVFANVGSLLDVLAIVESTADDAGVGWRDERRFSQEELAEAAAILRAAPDAEGPFSIAAPRGRVTVAAPASSNGFSRFTGVVLDRGVHAVLDGVLALEMLSSVAGAARQRVMAERELRANFEQQRFLSELSTRAAVEVADDVTLQEILEEVRDHLGVTAVSTLIRDGDEFVLIATTDFLGTMPLVPGTRSDARLAHVLELSDAGHFVRDLASFDPRPGASLNTYGEVLCVPRFGPDGIVGIVVFTDVVGRSWTPGLIEAAKSVSRTVQKLTIRAETERLHQHRRSLDKLLSDVASVAAHTTLDNLDEVVVETFGMAIDCFGIRAVSIWATGAENSIRIMARRSDGTLTRDPVVVPISPEERADLVDRGHRFVRIRDLTSYAPPDAEPLIDADSVALIVPIGPDPSGLLVFADPERWWSEEDVIACRTLANLADQTRARLHADTLLRSRLRDGAFTAAVAAMSVDVDLENVDERLDDILGLAVEHYGVKEASIWRLVDGQLVCRSAVRHGGDAVPFGSTVVAPDLGPLVARGWAVARIGDLDLGGLTRLDGDDATLLITSYHDGDRIGGVLVLTDSAARYWDEQHISSAGGVADTIGHLRMRMQVARRLAQQQAIDEILAEASRDFVDTTLTDARETVTPVLEKLRDRFGLAGISLLQLDHPTLQMVCGAEVTDDGLRLLDDALPIPRDHPAIARVLDPNRQEIWRLGDLFAVDATADHVAVIIPAVRGRDLLVLVAAHRPGTVFDPQVTAALGSLTGLLEQLRRRLLLEAHSRRWADADQLVAEIARRFVEQPPYDHHVVVEDAMARIGEFFDLRAVGHWTVGAGGVPTQDLSWGRSAADRERLDTVRRLPADDPIARLIREVSDDCAAELGAGMPLPDLRSNTLTVHRLGHDGEGSGRLVTLADRPPHRVADLDIRTNVIAQVARLMEQLARRADADLAVTHRLRHEDRLRRFATHLVTTKADASERLDDSFRELFAAAGVDQATIFHFQPTAEGFEVNAVLHAATDEVGPLPERYQHFVLPAGFTDPDRAPHFSADASTWNLDEAPEGLQRMVRASLPPGPRQIAYLPAPGGDPAGEASYMALSRPGTEPFRDDELEFFRSAHSILIQHEARVTAERWFGAAFNSAPVGISLRESDFTLIHCNGAYAELVGRPVAELVGTTLYDVMPDDMAEERMKTFADGNDGMQQVESSYRRPDGTIRWASVRTTPVSVPGRRDPLLLTYSEDITEHRRSHEMLEYQATHDELTGLPNRRSLLGEISAELDRAGDCAVLVLDLDRFKVINDSLGHSVGDQLLVTCADRIRLSLRPGDSVSRLGGDEFAILLRSPADHHSAGVVADRLLALLREPVVVGDDEVFPSGSIGVAIPEPGDTVEDLVRHADAAMYQAKGLGRDRWEAFDSSMRKAVVERIRTESDLRRAIDNGQLEVHYQPEFLLESGRIVGTEALVRWRHPERGLLTAGAFIGLAEETGLVVDIGRWVLSMATRQAAEWMLAGHDVITRVNLSARQLRGAVVSEVEAALAAAALPPDRLCLELTETAIMDDVQESALILARFHDLGVHIAIDDFGTGFSSLAYLKRFPVDILKIDRTFVDGVGVDPDDTAIVRSVIGLARTLRLDVVAEGIEDAAQVGELLRLGCDRGQGFHLARPAPADAVSRLFAGDSTVSGDPVAD